MPSSLPRLRPEPSAPAYVYRRQLSPREQLPAVGVAIGVGLAAFYVARLFLQRTPLLPAAPRAARPGRRPAGE